MNPTTNSFEALSDMDSPSSPRAKVFPPTAATSDRPLWKIAAKPEPKTDTDTKPAQKTDTKPVKKEMPAALHKTALCKNFEAGSCKYGKRCSFAHGKDELCKRPAKTVEKKVPAANPLRKTALCKNFEAGSCKYGKRCSFAHGKDELCKRPKRTTEAAKPTAKVVRKVPAFEYRQEEFPKLPVKEALTVAVAAATQISPPPYRMNINATEFVPTVSHKRSAEAAGLPEEASAELFPSLHQHPRRVLKAYRTKEVCRMNINAPEFVY